MLFQIKTLKIGKKKLKRLGENVLEFIPNLISDISTFFRRSKRLYHWSKFMWTNWDFDSHSIFPLLEYKLKRLEHCLNNGHAIHEPKDLKALRIAIKLCKRISDEYHETKVYSWHERKWGELKTWFTPYDGDKDLFIMNFARPKANTDQEKAEERADLMKRHEIIEPWLARDTRNLFNIVQKYYRAWWD
jgi:hypothetical protein